MDTCITAHIIDRSKHWFLTARTTIAAILSPFRPLEREWAFLFVRPTPRDPGRCNRNCARNSHKTYIPHP
jgi:hypothetical protein